jgi:hypothetical protein
VVLSSLNPEASATVREHDEDVAFGGWAQTIAHEATGISNAETKRRRSPLAMNREEIDNLTWLTSKDFRLLRS